MAWRPKARAAQRALEDPYENVPEHLAQPLFNWIASAFADGYHVDMDRFEELAIHLRTTIPGKSYNAKTEYLRMRANEDATVMLDLAEALLELYGWDGHRAIELDNLLTAANSLYRVEDGGRGLEERVAPGVKDAVAGVVTSAAGSAGDHLADAWNEAYGRQHDPVKSYSESIKAAEAALAARVSPQNGKQTLGTMIRDVSAKPSKWEFAIADGHVGGVETVLHMMRMLWDGQTSRHGGVNPTRSETLDEARAAVHLGSSPG